jgi:leucyl-tRNA synthetase
MINQGMILGRSSIAHRITFSALENLNSQETIDLNSILHEFTKDNTYISYDLISEFWNSSMIGKRQEMSIIPDLKEKISNILNIEIKTLNSVWFTIMPIKVDINRVNNDRLNIDSIRQWRKDFSSSKFIQNNENEFVCSFEIEKMSKGFYNVQTPDELVEKFGADTLRMYEMFLGPLEQTKPWDTKGINGVSNFVRKTYRLFVQEEKSVISDAAPSKESLKTLHKTIKKIGDDLERFSFNTCISTLMICVNELTEQKCHSREVLTDLVKLLAPFAPFIAEELWEQLGNEAGTISAAGFPVFNENHLIEANITYPISFNGKMRFNLELPKDMPKDEVEKQVMSHENTAKYLDGNTPKKVIVVPGKIVNVVV